MNKSSLLKKWCWALLVVFSASGDAISNRLQQKMVVPSEAPQVEPIILFLLQ
ncbi:hypothetical protein [Flavihumibacter sp. UBA7668]|uniref:hypothetical protein n=1 Tax=Flavihumibacter sp. UBA7668 TaxID=1946542 RepID=UPI0025C4209C|nr:hypothetical protein [Flavihumibacter sp. UBA7668]